MSMSVSIKIFNVARIAEQSYGRRRNNLSNQKAVTRGRTDQFSTRTRQTTEHTSRRNVHLQPTLTFERDLDMVKMNPACEIFRLTVIHFTSHCPHTHTHTHTGPIARRGLLKRSTINRGKSITFLTELMTISLNILMCYLRKDHTKAVPEVAQTYAATQRRLCAVSRYVQLTDTESLNTRNYPNCCAISGLCALQLGLWQTQAAAFISAKIRLGCISGGRSFKVGSGGNAPGGGLEG